MIPNRTIANRGLPPRWPTKFRNCTRPVRCPAQCQARTSLLRNKLSRARERTDLSRKKLSSGCQPIQTPSQFYSPYLSYSSYFSDFPTPSNPIKPLFFILVISRDRKTALACRSGTRPGSCQIVPNRIIRTHAPNTDSPPIRNPQSAIRNPLIVLFLGIRQTTCHSSGDFGSIGPVQCRQERQLKPQY